MIPAEIQSALFSSVQNTRGAASPGVYLPLAGRTDDSFIIRLPGGNQGILPQSRGVITASGVFVSQDNFSFISLFQGAESPAAPGSATGLLTPARNDSGQLGMLKQVAATLAEILAQNGDAEAVSRMEGALNALSAQLEGLTTAQGVYSAYESFFTELVSLSLLAGGYERLILNEILHVSEGNPVAEGYIDFAHDYKAVAEIIAVITNHFPSLRRFLNFRKLRTIGTAYIDTTDTVPRLLGKSEIFTHLQAQLVSQYPRLLAFFHPRELASLLMDHRLVLSMPFFKKLNAALSGYEKGQKDELITAGLTQLILLSSREEADSVSFIENCLKAVFNTVTLEDDLRIISDVLPGLEEELHTADLLGTMRYYRALLRGIPVYEELFPRSLKEAVFRLGYFDEVSDRMPFDHKNLTLRRTLGHIQNLSLKGRESSNTERHDMSRLQYLCSALEEKLAGYAALSHGRNGYILPPLWQKCGGNIHLVLQETQNTQKRFFMETVLEKLGKISVTIHYTAKTLALVAVSTENLQGFRWFSREEKMLVQSLKARGFPVLNYRVENREKKKNMDNYSECDILA
ncbi:MAG: hypothetical protein ACQEQ4_02935 [Fibrobacterota bacterium]